MGSGTSTSKRISLPPDPDWSTSHQLASKSLCPKSHSSAERSNVKKSQTVTNKATNSAKESMRVRLESKESTNVSDKASNSKRPVGPRKPSSDSNSQASADLELFKPSSPDEVPGSFDPPALSKMVRTASTNSEPSGDTHKAANRSSEPNSPPQKQGEPGFDTSNPVYISKMSRYPNCVFVKKYGRSNIGQMICIRDKSTFEEFTICV